MNFSAVILAGGKSSRMGRDKAWLEFEGQPLLVRQIQLAREAGASEVFISGQADADYSAFECRVLVDRFPGAGPLAGMERALAETSAPLALALAVDMVAMNTGVLRRLASHCVSAAGAIPRVAGRIEPLAAFYPRAGRDLIAKLLKEANSEADIPGAKDFAETCVANKLAVFVDLPAADQQFFANWNSPADLPCTI